MGTEAIMRRAGVGEDVITQIHHEDQLSSQNASIERLRRRLQELEMKVEKHMGDCNG